MTLSENVFDATIIGGGYIGMTAAHRLSAAGKEVMLIEKQSFLGGLGETVRLSNESRCEKYYHHFFCDDKELIDIIDELGCTKITYKNTSMGIYKEGVIHSWNGIESLFQNQFLSLLSKLRFCAASLLLAKAFLPRKFLLYTSLATGLRQLYGNQAFNFVWRPLITGKFGVGANSTPLIWMHGRLKQRLDSRRNGKEMLGYIKGSLEELTEKLSERLKKNNCMIELSADLKKVDLDKISRISYRSSAGTIETIKTRKVLFATSANIAREFLSDHKTTSWKEEEFYTAICILIELDSRLSEYYWVNIADTSLYYCGYIEQTLLTGANEYEGSHVAYLTKYLHPSEINSIPSTCELKELALNCLEKMFPKNFSPDMVIGMKASISNSAQAVNNFKFTPNNSYLYQPDGVYMANITHVYPDERSINNAIAIGNQISSVILNDLS